MYCRADVIVNTSPAEVFSSFLIDTMMFNVGGTFRQKSIIRSRMLWLCSLPSCMFEKHGTYVAAALFCWILFTLEGFS